jgi:hypothetical protein
MSISLKEIKESKPRAKFYSEFLNKVFSKTEILKIVQWDWDRISDEDNFNHFILHSHSKNPVLPCDLQELNKIQIIREGKIHGFDCEFATGNKCNCWCGEKYHGMNGAKL